MFENGFFFVAVVKVKLRKVTSYRLSDVSHAVTGDLRGMEVEAMQQDQCSNDLPKTLQL